MQPDGKHWPRRTPALSATITAYASYVPQSTLATAIAPEEAAVATTATDASI